MNPEEALTILMNADRKTRTMVKTPTRVLFSLDWTIRLERVCRGTGKSWERGGGGGRTEDGRTWIVSGSLQVGRRRNKNSVL